LRKTGERDILRVSPWGRFGSGRLQVDKERIKTFATEFDPQPFDAAG
jgi:hypothetical protein